MYDCETCDRTFPSEEALHQHERDSPAHAITYDCETCNRTFTSEEALHQHKRDSPAHAVTYDCETCDRTFISEEALHQHERDSPAHAITYDCETCNRTFISEEALHQHKRDSPAHAITYDSETCDKTFTSEEALHQHERDSSTHASAKGWSMHASLHDDVSQLLKADGLLVEFHATGGFQDCVESYDTNIMGRFNCSYAACPVQKWSSKMIAITIRLYRNQRYNAIVWHQRCQHCNSLGQPMLDGTYAERIAYRLKRWFGIQVEVPYYSGQSHGPHQRDLCEGCNNGHCRALL
jgi:DNA-directed RNA polymerase subunit RPC12/RpoP